MFCRSCVSCKYLPSNFWRLINLSFGYLYTRSWNSGFRAKNARFDLKKKPTDHFGDICVLNSVKNGMLVVNALLLKLLNPGTTQSGTQGSHEYHSQYQSGYGSVCILRYLSLWYNLIRNSRFTRIPLPISKRDFFSYSILLASKWLFYLILPCSIKFELGKG